MNPTQQQSDIIAAAKAGKNIAIQAYAGAAKTTTCVMIADERPVNSLYIAFNKDIATEAEGKFPSYVTCQTVHSIAYRAIVKFPKSKLGQKLKSSLSLQDILQMPSFNALEFQDEDARFESALAIREFVTSFCQSASFSIESFVRSFLEVEDEAFIKVVKEYWDNLTNELHPAVISHDVYLKMYHLTEPVISNKEKGPYEVIYLDEAQDSNPVTLDLFYKQHHAQKIMVGDPFQAIYAWRGAINAFETIPESFEKLVLSESFRYTQDIANQAANILSWFGKSHNITGKGDETKFNKEYASYAIICRNNSTVLGKLIAAADAGEYVYCNINLQELFAKVYHISSVLFNKEPRYPVADLKQYKTSRELLKASEKDQELKTLINLVKTLSDGAGLFTNINNIKKYATEDKQVAKYAVTTAHKSKGLQWNYVILCEDLAPKLQEGQSFSDWVKENPQEVNLLYVAYTRSQYKVILEGKLNDFI